MFRPPPRMAQLWPNRARFGRVPANAGRFRRNFGRVWPISGEIRAGQLEGCVCCKGSIACVRRAWNSPTCSRLAEIGPSRPQIGRIRPNSAKCARIRAKLSWDRAEIAPTFGRIRPGSTKFRATWADSASLLPKLARVLSKLTEFDRVQAKFDATRRNCDGDPTIARGLLQTRVAPSRHMRMRMRLRMRTRRCLCLSLFRCLCLCLCLCLCRCLRLCLGVSLSSSRARERCGAAACCPVRPGHREAALVDPKAHYRPETGRQPRASSAGCLGRKGRRAAQRSARGLSIRSPRDTIRRPMCQMRSRKRPGYRHIPTRQPFG